MREHCNLCDHQILSLEKGSICGVTNYKPDFTGTCVRINLNTKLEEKLEVIILNLEYLKYKSKKVYTSVILRLIIGVIILILGSIFLKSFIERVYGISGYYTKLSTIVVSLPIVVGYYYIKYSIRKMKKHKKDINETILEKKKIDQILRLYNKKYSYKVDFDKEVHGTQEAYFDIKVF